MTQAHASEPSGAKAAQNRKSRPAIQSASAESAPSVSRNVKVGLGITAALLIAGWYKTFIEMWLRWYPGWESTWDTHNLSFTRRFTIGDSYYSHGPLVPLACLAIAWFIYRRVGLPAKRTRGSTVLGWGLLLGSLALHLVSVYARVTFTSGLALIGVLGALLLLWGGRPLVKAYWLPVLFLVFMVPLPWDWVAKLSFQLKYLAGGAALWLTNEVFSVPAIMDGSFVHLPPAPDGSPKMLVVENVCSGLRSLISLVWFGSFFAMICRVRGYWRLVMVLLSVPLAVGCNIVRITMLNVSAHHWGLDVATEGGIVHDLGGLVVFALALGALFGIESLILGLGRWLKRPWADTRVMGYLDRIPHRAGGAPALLRPGIFAVLLGAVALSLFWSRASVAANRSLYASTAVPTTIDVGPDRFVSEDREMDEKTLRILETNDYLNRRFYTPVRGSEGRWFELSIVFSPDNRKGTHPPEVCLEGAGQIVVSKDLHTLQSPGVGEISMRELITQSAGNSMYHLYVYKCGSSYSPSFWVQQLTIILNGMINRNASGALIRLSLPTQDNDVAAARTLAMQAARTLLPQIDKNLP